VRNERQQTRKSIALSFQNNSGVSLPQFSVLLLFPLALCATIEGIPSVAQEGKYDRFTFDVAVPLADRATISGPIIHLSGDPGAAPIGANLGSC
jgi:hypothetical protein